MQLLGRNTEKTTHFFNYAKSGVSYNYLVTFSGKKYILKIDNPENNNALKALGKGIPDQNERAENFNKIAKIINYKIIQHHLKSPTFIMANGQSEQFCIKSDEDENLELPIEFKNKIVSMQEFIHTAQTEHKPFTKKQTANLAQNLGRLHRPSKTGDDFETAQQSKLEIRIKNIRQRTENYFGKTKEKRIDKLKLSAQNIEKLINHLASNNPRLYQDMLGLFPDGKCDPNFLSKILETICTADPQRLPHTLQISHTDLHRGNMVMKDDDIYLIDFDDIGKTIDITGDVAGQFIDTLDIFGYETKGIKKDLQINQELLDAFLTSYISYNPYLSKEEFKRIVDLSIKTALTASCNTLINICELAEKFNQDEKTPIEGIRFWPIIFKVFEQQLSNKELIEKAFERTYDNAFKSNQSQLVNALDLEAPKIKNTRNQSLEALDLAYPHHQPKKETPLPTPQISNHHQAPTISSWLKMQGEPKENLEKLEKQGFDTSRLREFAERNSKGR